MSHHDVHFGPDSQNLNISMSQQCNAADELCSVRGLCVAVTLRFKPSWREARAAGPSAACHSHRGDDRCKHNGMQLLLINNCHDDSQAMLLCM